MTDLDQLIFGVQGLQKSLIFTNLTLNIAYNHIYQCRNKQNPSTNTQTNKNNRQTKKNSKRKKNNPETEDSMASPSSAHSAKTISPIPSLPPASTHFVKSAQQNTSSSSTNAPSAAPRSETKNKQTTFSLIISYSTTSRSLNPHKYSSTRRDSNNTKTSNAKESIYALIQCWRARDWQSGRYKRFGLRLVHWKSSQNCE